MPAGQVGVTSLRRSKDNPTIIANCAPAGEAGVEDCSGTQHIEAFVEDRNPGAGVLLEAPTSITSAASAQLRVEPAAGLVHSAIHRDNLAEVERLLTIGANIEEQDKVRDFYVQRLQRTVLLLIYASSHAFAILPLLLRPSTPLNIQRDKPPIR